MQPTGKRMGNQLVCGSIPSVEINFIKQTTKAPRNTEILLDTTEMFWKFGKCGVKHEFSMTICCTNVVFLVSVVLFLQINQKNLAQFVIYNSKHQYSFKAFFGLFQGRLPLFL